MSKSNQVILSKEKLDTKFLLVRHGTTDYNVEKRLQGWIDIPLNQLGRGASEELAEKVQKDYWDIVVSSDLLRARQTAEIIADKHQLPIFLYKELRERCFGCYEGQLIHEVKILREKDDRIHEEGEDKDEFVKRIFGAFKILTTVFCGKNIIVVSHGAFLKNFCKNVFGDSPKFQINLESIKVAYANEVWKIEND